LRLRTTIVICSFANDEESEDMVGIFGWITCCKRASHRRGLLAATALLLGLLLSIDPALAQLIPVRNDGQTKAIIFVHGIGGSGRDVGNSLSTWTNANGAYWPQLVADDPYFKGIDIFSYRYLLGQDIQGLADQISTAVFNSQTLSGKDDLYIVGHSMGGLIVRRAILSTNLKREKIKALFLFGVPMDGSSWANWANYFADDRALNQLRSPPRGYRDRDDFLGAMRADWINARISIASYCAYETVPIAAGKVIVQSSSVEPLCNSAIVPVEGDHQQIVKPSSIADTDLNAEPHRVLREWFKRAEPDWLPDNKSLEQTTDVVVANCTAGRRYTRDIHRNLADLVSSNGLKARVSQPLPSKWAATDRSRIWRARRGR
jgi:pimeloyl-ACP methyl ester carboxylesterase